MVTAEKKTSASSPPVGAVLVVGAGVGGMQAALDLAEAGFKVYLVDKTPALGGRMAQLDKTFPTNDCAMCIISPRLVECARHPNIDLLTSTQVEQVTGEAGHFQVQLRRLPTYVDPEKCNACGDCVEVCPVRVPDEFNEGLGERKAIYKRYPQAIPNTYAITKKNRPPCQLTCPAGVNVPGYLALIAQGKFSEALELIRERHPLPAVCGRVCHRPCEAQCHRGERDEPVAINALKRFVADYERWRRLSGESAPAEETPLRRSPPPAKKEGKVAIVGSGPAGLTAASDLARMGYQVTIFEALPVLGGMLQVGIPAYRLPKEVLNADLGEILALGIEVRPNTPLGPQLTLRDLQEQGYRAIFLAVGAQRGVKLGVPGEEDYQGVLDALTFLKRVNLGDRTKPGDKVLVIGGGNSAIDAARTALRLGCREVTVVYRRTRKEMPAIATEVAAAEEEGVRFHYLAAPVRIRGQEGKVTGVECVRMRLGEPDESGRRRPIPLEGSEFVLEADTVILAVGQRGDFSFLTGEEPLRLTDRGTLEVDEITLATGMPGVFAGGDAVLGPSSVVEAVAQGHEAAISIDRYLSGQDLKAGRVKPAPVPAEAPPGKLTPQAREPMPQVPPDQRIRGFEEVERGFSRAQALAEAQRCLHCGICAECMQCVQVCQPQAIDHTQQEEVFTLSVGAVILALGVEGFRPELRGEYGYGQCANVVTSLEFERLLSPSGPFQGEVRRPSDGQPPQRIAWIQCVGSRDVQCGNPYCSSVCCMYATKQAIIAKEHQADLQATVFFNDLRAFGKGFERYYERAKEEYGVRYLKSLVSTVKELQQSQNLLLQYVLDDGKVHEEEFDLVVLSVGLTPTAEAQELARRLGVELNAYGFVQTSKFRPNETSRPGIFVCGAFERPMDIPETVMTASSAAAWAAELLAAGRGQWVREKTYPPERDLQGEEPRVGVFVCHCGTNIARVVKVEEVVEYARTLDSVAHAEHNLYTCSTDAQRQIVETIQEKGLNRVVVASCTPRTHEPLFQDMLREAGLNPYLLEMANIRDQCSWVHADWPRQATAKAKDLVRMAVARARRLEPLPERLLPVQPRGLVLGGGVAGMTAALSLARQGFETYLVEREAELGGRLRDLRETLEGEDPQQHLHWLRQQVEDEPRLTVYTEAQVKDFSGHLGHFRTRIQSKGQEVELEHGILILATGGVEYRPKEYLYGQDERVLTQLELEKRLSQGRQEFTQSREVVMIQCVGSRDEEHPYCSRICCSEAVKNALALKRLHPETNVYVLYRDLRTYGFQEEDYRRAREAGVLFIRYDPQTKPTVRQRNGKLEVEVYDSVLGTPVRMQPDYLVLSSAIRPHPAGLALAERFKIPVDSDGFFLEAHLKLRPLDFANEGMYLCGLAHAPKFLHETIAQARGAAARAATILAREYLPVSSIVATVEEEKCAACLTCVRLCPFEVPRLREEVAWIDPAVCQGCGICASACPARAIQIGHYRDEQILAMCEDLYG